MYSYFDVRYTFNWGFAQQITNNNKTPIYKIENGHKGADKGVYALQ